jgi:hypothetical protein
MGIALSSFYRQSHLSETLTNTDLRPNLSNLTAISFISLIFSRSNRRQASCIFGVSIIATDKYFPLH